MTGNRVTFEVQIYSTDHWVIDRSFRTEAEARGHGKKLFASPRCSGYRIIRDWAKPTGRHFETEILSEFRAVGDALGVIPIEDAPICTTDSQYYDVGSRMAIGRLLRHYVERAVVTPTEIMHHYGEMKRLLETGLVPTALGRVASLQSNKGCGASPARRDAMTQAITRIADRARIAMARTDLPALKDCGLSGLYQQLSPHVPADDLGFSCLVVLSRDLVQMRSWGLKLDFLVEMIDADLNAGDRGAGDRGAEVTNSADAAHHAPLALLDGVCADILGTGSVLPTLLGPQRALIDTLIQTTDLCQGRLAPPNPCADPRLSRINAALASPILTQCRTVLFDGVRRQIKGMQPLTFGDDLAEQDAFGCLLARLTDTTGILGGGSMAEALTIRYSRTLTAGGATGRRQAIVGMMAKYSNAADRVRYLLSLTTSDLGYQHASDIAALLGDLIGNATCVRPFLTAGAPLTTSLEHISGLYDLIVGSGLDATARAPLACALDRLLARYLVEHRVVHQFDQPGESLQARADRLLRLCIPGVLRSPQTLETVRALVIAHLRQPGFEQRYTQGVTDPAARQAMLRNFYCLLSTAGFC